MESIKVTTENLTAKAREVEQKANDYLSDYNSLFQEVETLTTTDWKGDDANAFKTQIEGFRDDFEKMKKLMDDYADFMRKAATNYETTQGNVISQIKSLQN